MHTKTALKGQIGSSQQRFLSSSCAFILDRFTLGYQKLCNTDAKVDPTRSQFSSIINHVQVIDCSGSTEKVYISSFSKPSNFLDLRAQTRGSGDGGLAKIDLLQVKVAHGEKKAEEVFIHTT